jgi:hypothetical protein
MPHFLQTKKISCVQILLGLFVTHDHLCFEECTNKHRQHAELVHCADGVLKAPLLLASEYPTRSYFKPASTVAILISLVGGRFCCFYPCEGRYDNVN